MKDHVVVAVLASAVALLGALLISVAVFWIIKSRRKLISHKSRLVPVEMKPRRFTYREVVKMTQNFQRVIGKGGFGNVYHGQLDGAPVAVKLYRTNYGSAEFLTEVNVLTKVYHKNLINLIGYCEEDESKKLLALVFEFTANGDLKKNLTGSGYSTKLTWERRLGIAIDVAKALSYLQEDCEPPIIHRDIKTSNILLSDNFGAKLSEFSLAVDLIPSNDDESHVSIEIAGTFGYIDPQYYVTGKLTLGSDVYGFGVVLMEIITGKPAFQRCEEGPYGLLTQWVSSMFGNGEVESIVDERLEGNFDIHSVEEALKIAMACSSENSNDRPMMSEVVVKLKHCLQMERARLNESISFNPTTTFD